MKKNTFASFKNKISFKRYPILFLTLFLLTFFFILYIFNRFQFTPKILLFCLIILTAVFLGKLQILLKDWFVFFSFIYFFDSMRGTIYILTCKLNLPVYAIYVVKIEKFLFGNFPSVWFQNLLLKGEDFTWFEKLLTIIHGTHFVAFLFVGLIIWLHNSSYFKFYKTSFYLVTLLGVSGYIIIPTVPPWMAYELFNIIPKITHFNILIYNMTIPDITSGFTTNPVAAMPSLHAAFPILCGMILWRSYRWKASIFYLYASSLLFTIVYTGDHYVVDIVAGAILAIVCYFLAFKIKKVQSLSYSQKASVLKSQKKNFLMKNNSFILGVLMLILGISVGLINKNQFENHYDQYNYLYAPNYIDFFKHEENYKQNYHVQIYLGNHFIVKKEYKKALFYFEHALNVSNNFMEKKQAQMKIRQCQLLLKQNE